MPIILAIETSAELASVALLRGEQLVERASAGAQTHSQSVLPMIQALLAEHGMKLAEVDALAFGEGPGSFTGVRTACGVTQGLAFGAALPVVAVGTLMAMAQACRARCGSNDVLAVLDARMGEVYWAQYRHDGSAWQTVSAPALAAPADVNPQGAVTACGNGFAAYAEAFAGKSYAAGAHADIVPHAAEVAQLASTALAAGRTITAEQVQPLYLRNKVALTTREREERARA